MSHCIDWLCGHDFQFNQIILINHLSYIMHANQDIKSEHIIHFEGVVYDKEKMTSKEIQRLELEIAVSKYTNQGNEIKTLAPGETAYPDGKLPPLQNQKARLAAPPISPEKTKHIAEETKRTKAIKKVANQKKKEPSKPKATVTKLDPEEIKRRKEVADAHREAALKGLSVFQATCAKHGLTEYVIYADCCKCRKCVEDRRKKKQDHSPSNRSSSARLKIIAERRAEAVAKGVIEFQGVCQLHGETLYKIQGSGSRCQACKSNTDKNSRNSKRTEEQLIEIERIAKNKPLLQKAIEDGVSEFDAHCKHCGFTKFRLKPVYASEDPNKKYSFCIECNRKRHRKPT